jgi:hypothetical protein
MDRSAASVGAGRLRAEENANREVGGEIVVYEAADGGFRVEVVVGDETVWLTQTQVVELFGRDQSVISRHIGSLFREGELPEKGNMQILHIASGGDRPTTFYNLDVIISVGYRVKSKRGTQFRIWATNTLRDHLIRGYTLNEKRLRDRGVEIEQAEGATVKVSFTVRSEGGRQVRRSARETLRTNLPVPVDCSLTAAYPRSCFMGPCPGPFFFSWSR